MGAGEVVVRGRSIIEGLEKCEAGAKFSGTELLAFDRAQKPFDEAVFQGPAATVHTDGHLACQKLFQEGWQVNCAP